MEARNSNLDNLIKLNDIQFVIPVYQRNYDWTEKHCKVLLNDIIEAGKNKKEHFIGSIVYVNDNKPATSVKELIVVDGQQRLTTITLIYLRLYRLLDGIGNEPLKNKIYKQYLINEFANTPDKKIKLKPTANNDKALKHIYDNVKISHNEKSNIIDNYTYFENNITENNYKEVLDGLRNLIFIDMALNKEYDDPQRIFESLNSTGLALSQGDLIRNYILMKLNSKEQEEIYEKYWEYIEKDAKDESKNENMVSDFIRDFMTSEYNKIPNKSRVYEEFKEKYSIVNLNVIKNYLGVLKEYASYYNKLLNPKKENDKDISLKLDNIKSLEVNVSYPFFLKIYKDYNDKIIDKEKFIYIIDLIESFVFRRFICDVPTNAMNKIFMTLYRQIDKNNYVKSLEEYLCKLEFSLKFPKDEEFISKFKEKNIYESIAQKKKMYLFNKLEQGLGKEVVDFNKTDLTIEHIFPQNPDGAWEEDLTEEEYSIAEKNLHKIANLTLSANNGALGNKRFIEKKNMNIDNGQQGYIYSSLWLNEYLKQIEEWNPKNIEERFEKIKERFLQVWRYPNIVIVNNNIEVNIFNADNPTGKKLEYIKFNGEEYNDITDVSKLFSFILKYYYSEKEELFFTDEIQKVIKITTNKKELVSDYPIQLSDIYYAENTYSSDKKFDLIKKLIDIFDREDELLIKYK
ncbi:DUF262 domain-containing protein [Brachyspira aalborgi]|uniref:DUF262 domain-containing protein n=1 Tax=Brachyspira aalborgi TaxID=29522 RepID=A0A5C8FS31_9SPIR|nr:DUF262 domain-containing protein [Brachyspira aalborgi]TXJ52464.1 DUF262 domain-containing protein [Brachyspira aalborgi]